VVAGVLFGSIFLLPAFFENVQGKSALSAGEYLITQGLAMGVGMTIAGVLYNRVGPRILATVGLVILVIGMYGLTQLNVNTDGWSLQVSLILRGIGIGFVNSPIQTLALAAVSNKAMAKASSLISVTRQVFAAIGVALLTTYLTQQTTNHATDIGNTIKSGLATHQFSGTAATCVQAAGPALNQNLVKACVTQYAMTSGLNDTFWIVMIFCAALIVFALIVGRDPAIDTYKAAKARGEDVKLEREAVLSE
jgi:DHA2 family multidrug resistance protein